MPEKDKGKDITEEQVLEPATDTQVAQMEVEEVEEVEESEVVKEGADKLFSNFEPQVEASQQNYEHQSEETVTVQPVRFASFEDLSQAHGEANKNLDILMDIKLQLTVELGRTELPIKKVLELTRGSIIELEKVAGEPVELYANGKLVAHGEVVVIEDNFGLRITSITDPEERLKGVS